MAFWKIVTARQTENENCRYIILNKNPLRTLVWEFFCWSANLKCSLLSFDATAKFQDPYLYWRFFVALCVSYTSGTVPVLLSSESNLDTWKWAETRVAHHFTQLICSDESESSLNTVRGLFCRSKYGILSFLNEWWREDSADFKRALFPVNGHVYI